MLEAAGERRRDREVWFASAPASRFSIRRFSAFEIGNAAARRVRLS